VGAKRVFAAALDWPGWARSGRDEAAAVAALLAYAPRYALAVRPARLGFKAPKEDSQVAVAERLKGDATTDFGAPGAVPSLDYEPLEGKELVRQIALREAAWQTFDDVIATTRGKALATGPRGDGRNLRKIVLHAVEAESAYLSRLGWKLSPLPPDPGEALDRLRHETRLALDAATRGEIAETGPRGGKRWAARTFIRRSAWHALDHAWEIEDRLTPARARSPMR
jgi:hypothetical protein